LILLLNALVAVSDSHFVICLVVRTAEVIMTKNLSGLADNAEVSILKMLNLLSLTYIKVTSRV